MSEWPDVTIRPAEPEEAGVLAQIDAAAWPPGLATDVAGFRSRIQTFSPGQLVATVQESADEDHVIAACGSAQRINSAFLQANSHSYNSLTDGNRFAASHDPDGEIWQLIGVAARPEYRGLKLGRRLVDRQIEQARQTPGIRRIIGFTRPAGYHRYPELTIDEYLHAVTMGLQEEVSSASPTGERSPLRDAVLAFHLKAGAQIVSVHRGFRPNDRQALGCGVLIEYPV